jgi:hypothetical protein
MKQIDLKPKNIKSILSLNIYLYVEHQNLTKFDFESEYNNEDMLNKMNIKNEIFG